MPQIKSAKKRMGTSAKAHERNKAVKSQIATYKRKFDEASDEDKKPALSQYFSILDKAVKKGVIKKGTADRRKSRASKA